MSKSKNAKPRLFLTSEQWTDGIGCHIGGPDPKQAVEELAKFFASHMPSLFRDRRTVEISLHVEDCTDAYVRNLPEL
jgi:hypothetical protein